MNKKVQHKLCRIILSLISRSKKSMLLSCSVVRMFRWHVMLLKYSKMVVGTSRNYFSKWKRSYEPWDLSESETFAKICIDKGVPFDRMYIENESTSIKENHLHVKKQFLHKSHLHNVAR